MDKRTLKNITMDECKNQESQLDSLWEIYGNRNVLDNPTDAKGTDILSKDGMMILMSAICGDTIVDLKKVEDESKKKYNIVAVLKNEEERIVFSFMKEDFLKKVIVRKSTQIDVESGVISKPNIVCMEFVMNSGNNKLVEMSEFKYEGTRTSSIETYINKNNGIEAVLLLAQNSDPTLKVEITRNGLMISSLISENQNQAKLVKKPDGFGIENLWEDGFPIEFASMSYSEYKNLESSDASDLNGDESNIKNPSMNIKTGCIYFINDKGFMILNGVRYGFNSIDSNSISVSKDENGNYLFNVKISGDANNLLSIKNDGIYAGLNWSGSKQNEQFGIQYDLEDVYKSLSQSEQSRILFICSDTKRVYANGIDISYVDKIGNKDDEDNSTVYGYINSKFLELNIENIVSELDKAVKYEDFELNGDKRKSITLENYDVLLGKMTNGSSVNLAMVSKWDVADFGSTSLPFNMNGSKKRPTYNDDEEIALMKDIEEIKLPIEFSFPLRTLQDKVYTQEEIFAWFGVTDAAELKTLIVREGQFYLKYGIQLSGNPYYYRMPIQYIAFESANQIKMVVIGLDTTNDMPTKYEIILNLDGTIAKGNSNIKVTSNDLAFANDDTIASLTTQINSLTTQINELKELINSITSRVDALEKA